MLKRILLISICYVIIIVTTTLTVDPASDAFLLIILISGLVFSFLLGRELYKKYFAGFKPKDQHLSYTASGGGNLIQISKKPFLFGLEKKLLSDDEFYFDNTHFYAVNANSQTAKFNLEDITEISRTDVRINNSSIWQVKINHENRELTFKFAHNYTIWNKGFLEFYDRVKTINPAAVKSDWSLWRM
ncbi:MAG: hypothetical protein EOO18_00170 [Chryseobacterium sp.]|nr:MAG: hypothetical protein EOO18_00170 [Chryseobacterium sp.]